jgi:hypothetical protein
MSAVRDKAGHRFALPSACSKFGFAKSSSLNSLDFNRLQQFLQIGLTFRKHTRVDGTGNATRQLNAGNRRNARIYPPIIVCPSATGGTSIQRTSAPVKYAAIG